MLNNEVIKKVYTFFNSLPQVEFENTIKVKWVERMEFGIATESRYFGKTQINIFILREALSIHIIVVTKKTPMGQIMHFSLYCINGLIEGKHITLKNSNNTLQAMKSELHKENFYNWRICPVSTHSCNKMITQNSTQEFFL